MRERVLRPVRAHAHARGFRLCGGLALKTIRGNQIVLQCKGAREGSRDFRDQYAHAREGKSFRVRNYVQ